MVKYGELPRDTALLTTATRDLSKVKSDNGIIADKIVWSTVTK